MQFGGTVPSNSVLFGGTVPPNSELFGGTVPPNKLEVMVEVRVEDRCKYLIQSEF